MNRAIDKYRVYDEEKKEYVSSRVFINHHGETCVIRHGGFYPHKVTKEHCTGLKDKNGRLIFEGDVLGVRCSDGVLIAYHVVWFEGAFHLLDPKSEFVNVATVCALRGNVRNDTCGYREIIGNIHENKVWK
ncbi:MAG: hypothetical protein IKA32_04750 [Lentisphaeria bacterium]|nr:hypothetical protein [Lentisphaeria bacterium]